MENPFEKWLKTEDAKNVLDKSILMPRQEQYLYNRLHNAFNAGLDSKEPGRLQVTIDWYEQDRKKLKKLIKELKAKIASLEVAQQQGAQQSSAID